MKKMKWIGKEKGKNTPGEWQEIREKIPGICRWNVKYCEVE